ncbi:hypothetical protein [Cellulomonas marina]|uniref:Uncharacterized protein n=1 Tax=Cellulomonas marina TaxID=988821 RepID=A0A1I0YG55_9CELL|nr:hypothetical protein [Cellulomonas marina]GIG28729.1 hypothetical protein Cma02nite_13290 [Cellulomonas marina]SFB11776.1 hypothetical protein SAMN05421867_107115 [Cellulomonas marina]
MTHVAEGGIATGGTTGTAGTTQTARDEASGVAHTAKDQAKDVAASGAEAAKGVLGDAKAEASGVAQAATQQARDLFGQARTQLSSQAGEQQGRLAGTLRTVSDQLGEMASTPSEGGIATDLVHEISSRVGTLAQRLENAEPAELLDDVRRFARQRPGTFLLIAGATGLVLGRLTRGAKDAASQQSSEQSSVPRSVTSGTSAGLYTPAPTTSSYGLGAPATTGYATSGLATGTSDYTAGYDDDSSTGTGVLGGTAGLVDDDADPLLGASGSPDQPWATPDAATGATGDSYATGTGTTRREDLP